MVWWWQNVYMVDVVNKNSNRKKLTCYYIFLNWCSLSLNFLEDFFFEMCSMSIYTSITFYLYFSVILFEKNNGILNGGFEKFWLSLHLLKPGALREIHKKNSCTKTADMIFLQTKRGEFIGGSVGDDCGFSRSRTERSRTERSKGRQKDNL